MLGYSKADEAFWRVLEHAYDEQDWDTLPELRHGTPALKLRHDRPAYLAVVTKLPLDWWREVA
jgi:hypothetical protein